MRIYMNIRECIDNAITSGSTVTIKYVKFDGSLSTRIISELEYSDEFGNDYISAFCHMRQERRTFKISRIREVDGISSTTTIRTIGVVKTAYNPQSSNSVESYNSKSSVSTTNTQQINVVKPHSVNISTSSNSNNYTQKRSEGCYVATMVYGDYDHSQVLALRRFRDNRLLTNMPGRIFVKLYYWISPKLVKILHNHKYINAGIRRILDKFISMTSPK